MASKLVILGALLVPLLGLLASAARLDFELEAASVEGGAQTVFSRSRREATKDTTKDKLTQADRKAFVKAHNEARSIVAPTATGMPFMTWNSTMENLAQRWALNCEFEHGQPDDAYKGKVGQNLWVGSGGFDAAGSVGAWDKEKNDYSLSKISCNEGAVCGHYTQVAWTKSTEVGCGIAYCETIKGFKKPGYIIVCNYQKPGNFKGKAPYENGPSCSDCPDGYPTCENKLCRKDPLCGDLKCNDGESMDVSTCLCDCGDDPNNERGGYCEAHPGAAAAVLPCLQLLTASILTILYSSL